jgi:RHS repeat-associated protein
MSDCMSGSTVASSEAYASGWQYGSHGLLTQMTLGNGLTETTQYNSHLQPTQRSLGSLWSLTNTYGTTANNGNVVKQTLTVPSMTTLTMAYSYDALNRLSVAGEYTSDHMAPTAYDTATNRVSGTGWSYDALGNVTAMPLSKAFSYDAENRLKSQTSTPVMEYSYDGEGHRVKATSGSVSTYYVYDAAGQLAAEYNRTVTGNGRVYLTADHLGSTRVVTDATGAVVERHDYVPFGDELTVSAGNPRFGITGYGSSTSSVTLKFTGKERDIDTGLDYFGARYFSAAQGRFTSPDALGGEFANPQSLNRYTYVLNNPLRFTDPTGMYVCGDDPKDGSSHCASKQDQAFEKSLAGLRGKDGDVGRAAAAYGAMNDANGVKVGFADLGKTGEGGVTRSTLGADANGNLFAQSDVTINSRSTGTALAADVGHEGSHVADAQDMVRGITITGGGTGFTVGVDISQYASEQRAYRVTDAIYRSANEPYNGYGNANCALGAGASPIGIGQRIDQILLANPQLYHSSDGKPLTQKNQGGNVLNLVVPH